MVREIQAKVLLSRVRQPDTLFGLSYGMNLYRGCQHGCIYCDSRSACYEIDDFTDIQVKVNALELLERELSRKRVKGTIGTGSMNDPYMPLEQTYRLTGQALEIIARYRFPVHVITKSDLVLLDLETLRQISQVYAAVSFTVTSADDALCRLVEPGAPPASRRFAAMRRLADAGILTGVTLMPVLPFLEDTPQNITAIVEQAAEAGAKYILPWFGMSLRDRQRDYFYQKLDLHFPGLRQRYERRFGDRYGCDSPQAAQLSALLDSLCARYGLSRRMPVYRREAATQMKLF